MNLSGYLVLILQKVVEIVDTSELSSHNVIGMCASPVLFNRENQV